MGINRCIVIVENRTDVMRILARVLTDDGYSLRRVKQLSDLFSVRESNSRVDLVVLDESAAGQELGGACQDLRSWYLGPLVVVSDYDSGPIAARTLDAGADDYIRMPLRPKEFSARIRALLRRPVSLEFPLQTARFGELELDSSSRSATYGGRSVTLTKVEFQLLAIFMRYPGRIITKDDIYSRIWGGRDVHEQLVRVHIGNLRKKLSVLGPGLGYLQTVSRGGYMLRDPRDRREGISSVAAH